MKKGLLLLLVGLTAFYGVTVKAMASARLDGMATDDRVVEDRDLIFTYANKALANGNMVDIRLFGTGRVWGGLLVKDDSLGVIGAYVNNPGSAVLEGAANADPKFDLFWAKDFSGAAFGVRVNYANTVTAIPGTYNREMGLQLGLGLNGGSDLSQINFHAGFDTASISAGGTSNNNAPSLITAGALLQHDTDANNDMRFFGDLGLTSDPGAVANASNLLIQLGAADNKKVLEGKGLVSSGLIVGVGSNSAGAGNSTSQFTLDWQANVEAQAESWLTIRTGFDKQVYNGLNQGAIPIVFAVGASVNYQNFNLDLNVTPGSLFNSIANIQPGNGIFYTNGNNILSVSEADVTYKF